MNISDYEEGTQFIILYRNQFKYEDDFEAICKFLKFSTDLNMITIPVDSDRCEQQSLEYTRS